MGAIVYDPMTGKFVSAQEAIADAAASGVATLTAGATTGGDTLKELEDRIAALEDAPGSGTSLPQRHLTLPFTFADKVALKAGLEGFADAAGDYVAADGDRIMQRWFEADIPFDGTTPIADIGTFGSITTGLLYWDDAPFGLDSAPDVGTVGDGMTLTGSGQVNSYEPAVLDGTAQPKVCASQTGATDGAQLDSTEGSAVAHIIVLLA